MTSPTKRLRVIASTPISEDLIAEIVGSEPWIDLVRDRALLPPQRFPGDHSGEPAFNQRRARHLVDKAARTAALADGRIRLAALDTVETVGVLLSTSARSTAS